ALRDVRVREIGVSLHARRNRVGRLDLGLRLRDRVGAAPEQAGVEAAETAAATRADAERRERDPEEDREPEEHIPLPPPEAREEEILVRITARRVLALFARRLGRRLRLRRLRLLRLYRCACHQAPRVAELEARLCRLSARIASQIESSNRNQSGI